MGSMLDVAAVEQVIINEIGPNGWRFVKVISDAEIDAEKYRASVPLSEKGMEVRAYPDAALGMFYLELRWPIREVVEVRFEGQEKARRLVIWSVQNSGRVSQAIEDAAYAYLREFQDWPQMAFMNQLPKGASNGMDVHDVMLMQADWALPGCVSVG